MENQSEDLKNAGDVTINDEGLPTIVWYPGHMAKARRLIEENLKLADVVLELVDARIPKASANPLLKEIIGQKPRLVVMTKKDLADAQMTKAWLNYYRGQNIAAVAVDAAKGDGIAPLVKKVGTLAASRTNKLQAKGAKARAPRAIVLGIPNVGKSSLINRLAGQAKARVENRPGVTRAKQWIHINGIFDLLDMPGILWPKFDDPQVALHLSFTGAISDEAVDIEPIARRLVKYLLEKHPADLQSRYKIDGGLPQESDELLEIIGKKRGYLEKGGTVNYHKAMKLILKEFRAGLIGKYTLDVPHDEEK